MLIKVQEDCRTPNELSRERKTPHHLIIKMPNIQNNGLLKAARKHDQVTYEGIPIRIKMTSQ